MSDYKLENGILQTPSGSCTLTSEFILPQLIREMVDEITRLQAQLDEAQEKLRQAEWSLSNRQNYIDVANGKLRWHKWPDEKPPKEGRYLTLRTVHDAPRVKLWLETTQWNKVPVSLWLPIPPTNNGDTAPQEGEDE